MRVEVRDLRVSAYVIPTATPESDGTLEWDSTTLVLVELEGGRGELLESIQMNTPSNDAPAKPHASSGSGRAREKREVSRPMSTPTAVQPHCRAAVRKPPT